MSAKQSWNSVFFACAWVLLAALLPRIIPTAAASEAKYSSEEWQHITANCTPESPMGPFLYSTDFSWDQTRDQLKARYEYLYASEKRLQHRAYFDSATQKFFVELYEGGRYIPVAIAPSFLRSLQSHIEEALRLKYADAILFSDMGHMHFLMPEEIYREQFSAPGLSTSQVLTGYFAEPHLKSLYHTAEQLKLTHKAEDGSSLVNSGKWDGWRYHTRNFVGTNDERPSLEILFYWGEGFNTVREYPGHYYGYSASFSANANGCFPFRFEGETYWFDFSLEDISPGP